jgi:hypothetical protein
MRVASNAGVAMLDWILPINQMLVLIPGIFAGIIGFGMLTSYLKRGITSTPKKDLLIAIALTIFGGSAWGWVICAGSQSPRIAKVVDYEVKVVTFPDGKQIQMFHVDGENKNANQMFACQVPENHVVRRTIYERVYCGLTYSKDTSSLKDTFAIVDPKKRDE